MAWEGLLAAGRAKGEVDADEVVHVLKDVELTHEVIEVVQVVFAREGISVVDAVDEADAPAAGNGAVATLVEAEAVTADAVAEVAAAALAPTPTLASAAGAHASPARAPTAPTPAAAPPTPCGCTSRRSGG